MQNLNFDDGYKEFTLNNDPNRVIRFNPSDFSIVERINTAFKEIEKAVDFKEDVELNTEGNPVEQIGVAAEIVKKANDIIKQQVDYIFNSPVSETVFGSQSPLSSVKGVPFYERVLDAIVPVIKKEIETEQKASQKRVEKYTKVYHK